MKDNKLISKPIQTPIQEFEEIEIIVPNQINKRNIIIARFLNI